MLDLTFDGDGLVFTDFGGEDAATDVELMPGGRVVAAGQSVTGRLGANIAFARYRPTAAPDNSFSGDGLQTVDFGGLDLATDMELQRDGAMVAAGASGTGGSVRHRGRAPSTATGAPDPSFSGDGRQTTALGEVTFGNAVALQPDGRILVSGDTASGGDAGDFAIFRYEAGGTLDPSFGAGGVVTGIWGIPRGRATWRCSLTARSSPRRATGLASPASIAGGAPDPGFGIGGRAPVAFDEGRPRPRSPCSPTGASSPPGLPTPARTRTTSGWRECSAANLSHPRRRRLTCAGRAATILAATRQADQGDGG